MSTTENNSWWVYIVECSDGTYYTGSTPNVSLRIERHNLGKGAKYTRARLPVTLIFTEKQVNRSEALKREHAIKQLSRTQKKILIDQFFSQLDQK